MTRFDRRRLKYLVQLVTERGNTRPWGMPYVGLENIEPRTGKLIQAQREEDGKEPDGASTVNLFMAGDIIFSKLRPYLAKGWHCTFDGACTTEALVLRPGVNIDASYLLKPLLSDEFIREVDVTTIGPKMPRAAKSIEKGPASKRDQGRLFFHGSDFSRFKLKIIRAWTLFPDAFGDKGASLPCSLELICLR